MIWTLKVLKTGKLEFFANSSRYTSAWIVEHCRKLCQTCGCEDNSGCRNFCYRTFQFSEIDRLCLSRYLELETAEFDMGSMMDAVVSQGMITSREKGLQLIRETPREIKGMCLFGDQVRLQQVLADYLLNAVRFTPSSEGWVGIKVVSTKKRLVGGFHVVHLEFR